MRVRGFTLVEMLVAILIIGILIGIVFGAIGFVFDDRDRRRALADIAVLRQGVEDYERELGHYPMCVPKLCSDNEILFMALAGLHGERRPLSPRKKPFVDFSYFAFDEKKFDPIILKLEETHDPRADMATFVMTDLGNLNFLDPWDNGYVYKYPRKDGLPGFRLYSLGPDGKEGGVFDEDNVEWTLPAE